ncbi:helix-turn-helix transcriptional regulator [Halorussus pelagicus]|uniref:helix-turn-helix transcriptional regulator n=1 Tax=Halorussus pelagicus TaxID=2505977 RepID=UPI000FFB9A66|nr:helix-turn-helix transcriptional regulator [Halorussus pelagicus]
MNASAGVRFADLHAFERDLLYAVRGLERNGNAPKGLAVKDLLEAEYDEELNHSRLYQNLDGLAERGLLTKGKKDDRTNEYATTATARDLLESRTERRAEQVGLTTNGGDV